jgi:hypothetical protein
MASASFGRPTSVPTDHDAIELKWRGLDISHDDHGPARLKQGAFTNHRLDRASIGFNLADNRKIEPPRNTTKVIRGIRHIRAEYSLFG